MEEHKALYVNHMLILLFFLKSNWKGYYSSKLQEALEDYNFLRVMR